MDFKKKTGVYDSKNAGLWLFRDSMECNQGIKFGGVYCLYPSDNDRINADRFSRRRKCAMASGNSCGFMCFCFYVGDANDLFGYYVAKLIRIHPTQGNIESA